MAEAYLGMGRQKVAGDATVNTSCRMADLLCDITTDHFVLLHTQTQFIAVTLFE